MLPFILSRSDGTPAFPVILYPNVEEGGGVGLEKKKLIIYNIYIHLFVKVLSKRNTLEEGLSAKYYPCKPTRYL
jgi:hypothetical protein